MLKEAFENLDYNTIAMAMSNMLGSNVHPSSINITKSFYFLRSDQSVANSFLLDNNALPIAENVYYFGNVKGVLDIANLSNSAILKIECPNDDTGKCITIDSTTYDNTDSLSFFPIEFNEIFFKECRITQSMINTNHHLQFDGWTVQIN